MFPSHYMLEVELLCVWKIHSLYRALSLCYAGLLSIVSSGSLIGSNCVDVEELSSGIWINPSVCANRRGDALLKCSRSVSVEVPCSLSTSSLLYLGSPSVLGEVTVLHHEREAGMLCLKYHFCLSQSKPRSAR